MDKEMVAEAAATDVIMCEESNSVSIHYTSSVSVEFTRSQSVRVFHILLFSFVY